MPFGQCTVAVRKGVIPDNPSTDAEISPPENKDIGQALDQDELKRLLDGFRGSVLFPMVAVAALTGLRLRELLALRWSDFNSATGTLRIERAIERTKQFGLRIKEPKSWRGKRTIEIDTALVPILIRERDAYLRMVAGVPDIADIDLSLIKLPPDALMFPSPVEPFSLTVAQSQDLHEGDAGSLPQARARDAALPGLAR